LARKVKGQSGAGKREFARKVADHRVAGRAAEAASAFVGRPAHRARPDARFGCVPMSQLLQYDNGGVSLNPPAERHLSTDFIMTHLEQLTTWLNSAYAMEQSMEKVLENHAKDAKDQPPMQSRIEEHIIETRSHAERVAECLEILGSKPSALKSAVGTAMGMVQGTSTGMFRDELVKNVLADYAAEHFEIACYRSLIAAAEALDQQEIAEICGEILEEEEAMAAWLEEHIEDITRTVLQQKTAA
jgi:ferritin-like metal-binding protein YciE